MAIKDISAAWKASLTKCPPAERFYADFRKQIFPPLSSGADPTAHNLSWWKVRKNGLDNAGNMPGSHHACIFKATTNLVVDPEDLTTVNWTNTNSTDLLSNYYIDGKRFTEMATTAANGLIYQPISFTGDGVKSVQCILRQGTNTTDYFQIYDNTATATRFNVTVVWATKSISVTTGSLHNIEWLTDNIVWISGITISVTAANVNRMRFVGALSGCKSYITALQAENSIYPTPYVNGSRLVARPDYVLPMPDSGKFTLRIDVAMPWFTYDTTIDHIFYEWCIDATHRFVIYWAQASDIIALVWIDGGAARYLVSQQFDDGTAFDDINQRLIIDAAIDLPGGQTGSKLWINRVLKSSDWGGPPDAKTSEFALSSIGHVAGGFQADSLFNQIILIPDYAGTDADVQNDYRDVKQEQVVWHFNGEGCARTRCNISRHVIGFANGKSIEDPVSRQQGANDFRLELENKGGIFSDDQYAAFNPTADNFNGLVTQKYLQKRCRIEAETWYGNNFELFFTGLLDENRFRRRSSVGELSIVDLSAEDMISIIGRKFKRAACSFENYKLSDPTNEAASLIHAITRLATKEDIYNFASNSSFENATIGNSWAVTGGTLTRQAGGLHDSFCGQLVPGAAAQYTCQVITFTGIKKLNVGEAWTFFIWLRSAGAVSGANAWITLQEHDAGGYHAGATTYYTLAGGEGFVMYAATHVIADSTSDRLLIAIGAPAGATLQFDGAMLIQSAEAINYFVLNNNDGAAGVEEADDADCAGYNTIGFDVDYVNIVHPWALVPRDEQIWEHVKQLGDACGNMYLGLDECGTLKLRAKLAAGYQDPASLETISSVRSVDASIEVEQANKIIGHAVEIVKLDDVVAVWIAAATGHFKRAAGSGELISEDVLNGAYWPKPNNQDINYWAKYGTVGS